MANQGTYFINLGKDPEELQVGERTLVKLRCAEKGTSKKAVTRWFTALVGGQDAQVAMRLKSGDAIAVSGELILTEYTPKAGPNKGKKQREDEMPFAKILRIVKSPSFFAGEGPADEEPAFSPEPEVPDLEGL
jgi:single-stranded DNA-binding protein